VLNVVHGGVPVGEMLSRHHGVNKIVFTGSVRAGRAIQIAAASSNLKPGCAVNSSHIISAFEARTHTHTHTHTHTLMFVLSWLAHTLLVDPHTR
jgi:uncharacterized RmlC-like cupin family protein